MLSGVASRKEQKEAARRAREQAHSQLRSSQQRRFRLQLLAGVVAIVVIVAIVFIVASSGGTKTKVASVNHKQAIATVTSLLKGIPQTETTTGDTLGDPKAPVTVTEYGDLVCPICDDFALTSEPELIATEVRTGKVKLVYRGLETASSDANGNEYVATQVAARAAGLQDLGWNYILLAYEEQPQTINGKDAETVPYITTAYLQGIASQIHGLNLIKWQSDLTSKALSDQVAADAAAAEQNGVSGTPTVFVTGPKGTAEYDKNGTESSAIPTLAQLQTLIAQVS